MLADPMDTFITQHLKGVSRTYAIVIPMLPRGLDEAVGLAYLLMRIVDTLEDAPQLEDGRRRPCLRHFDRVLAGADEPLDEATLRPLGELAAERALMHDTAEVLRRINALPPADAASAKTCARKMIGGVLDMLDRSEQRAQPYPAVRDSAELREYCYYVAGVVGEMLCEMMADHLKAPALLRLRNVAVELGIGLQLVNILKDAMKDSKHGRRYLPTADDGRVSAGEIYRTVLVEARKSLEKGAEFVLALPATAWQLRSFCGLPIAWGAMTLARFERIAGAAKIDRTAIQQSIEKFTAVATDDNALRSWFQRLLHPRGNMEPV
ncbi:MAG: squalene/phytoene synthase family protein [Phycisphaerales bacterium]|nr:squalene/phytoene synthase family protein [Phycisphaerales bacterium]